MREDKPSRTAYKVALNVVTLGAKSGMETIFPPGTLKATERLLVASGAASERTVRWSRSQWVLSIYKSFDWMLPGQFEAFAQRKAFCEHQVRESIGGGATQILVLGAGYDTLGWRLALEFPNVRFFEIDHPATSRIKSKGIDVMGKRDNLNLIPADLGKEKLFDVLESEKLWDRSGQTVIVAEGLVMYLAPEAVRDLFLQCALIAGADSRIAFTYIPSGIDGRPDAGRWTGLMLWLQKTAGEPWLWSIWPEELGPFLEGSGWITDVMPAGEARKHGVEFYAVAKRG